MSEANKTASSSSASSSVNFGDRETIRFSSPDNLDWVFCSPEKNFENNPI
jgi:hypothetical protein